MNSKARIFCSRFVDELKKVVDDFRRESRIVTQNFADDYAFSTVTKEKTLQCLPRERLVDFIFNISHDSPPLMCSPYLYSYGIRDINGMTLTGQRAILFEV